MPLCSSLATQAGDGRAAAAVERGQERALGDDGDARRLVVERREQLRRGGVAVAARDPDRPLGDGREHLLLRENARRLVREPEPLEPGQGEQGRGAVPLLQLAQAALHVAAEVDDLEVRVLLQELRLPPQGRCFFVSFFFVFVDREAVREMERERKREK